LVVERPLLSPQQQVVAIYARVSTLHHDQNPEVQLSELRRYCTSRNWITKEEIVDHGYSGSTSSRPGLKRLNELAYSRQISGIVVVKFDRLFRSLKHLVNALDEYHALGITFVSIKDNLDYSTPSGKFFIQVMGSLAELEKSLIQERTRAGLAHAVEQGKTLGRPRSNLDDKILELRNQGRSYREIERQLKCSSSVIKRVLKTAAKSPQNSESFSQVETLLESGIIAAVNSADLVATGKELQSIENQRTKYSIR